MVGTLEIIVGVLSATSAICGLFITVSEALPFIKKHSGNGVIHSLYHLIIKPDKCLEIIKDSDSSEEELAGNEDTT
tara:strand:- start:1429 stop:1656 length:228 start_codon:yes stop_codon:yes gene_type:complete